VIILTECPEFERLYRDWLEELLERLDSELLELSLLDSL
jgi:hypothetical protein